MKLLGRLITSMHAGLWLTENARKVLFYCQLGITHANKLVLRPTGTPAKQENCCTFEAVMALATSIFILLLLHSLLATNCKCEYMKSAIELCLVELELFYSSSENGRVSVKPFCYCRKQNALHGNSVM